MGRDAWSFGVVLLMPVGGHDAGSRLCVKPRQMLAAEAFERDQSYEEE